MNNISVEPLNESVIVSVSAPKNSVSVSFPPTENAQIYSELAKKYCDDAAHFSENAVTTIKNTVDNIESGLVNSVNAVADDLTNIDAVNSNKTNIDTVAANLSGISSVSANLTNINAVNSNKTNIDTVATNISSVNTVLSNLTNINTVAENISVVGDLSAEIDRIDQSKGKKSGTVSENADILADVKEYAHSTFDESKFTKVGTPTITSDGIASGFSDSKYFKCGIYDWSKPFKIKVFATPTYISHTNQILLSFDNNDANGLYNAFRIVWNAERTAFYISWDIDSQYGLVSTSNLPYSQIYLELIYNGTDRYTVKYKENIEDNWNTQNSLTTNKVLAHTKSLIIGDGINRAWEGSIDLKQFSITVDGVPVFSGNKTGSDTYTISGSDVVIPYTLSKTGSKIVDSYYRNEVTAVYNQFGYAPYYTLSDSDFTLPMGELYGMIARSGDLPHITETYINNESGYTVYSNGLCEQWGKVQPQTATTNVTVAFLKTYSGTDYNVSFGYEAEASGTFYIPIIITSTKATTGFELSQYNMDSSYTSRSSYWRTVGYIN